MSIYIYESQRLGTYVTCCLDADGFEEETFNLNKLERLPAIWIAVRPY